MALQYEDEIKGRPVRNEGRPCFLLQCETSYCHLPRIHGAKVGSIAKPECTIFSISTTLSSFLKLSKNVIPTQCEKSEDHMSHESGYMERAAT